MYNFEVELFACGDNWAQQLFVKVWAEDWNEAADKALDQFPDTNKVTYLVKGIRMLDDENDPN